LAGTLHIVSKELFVWHVVYIGSQYISVVVVVVVVVVVALP
jgi:hypothetical protein